MLQTIQKHSQSYLEEIITIRRHLHQYPELSFREEETSKFVTEKLKSWNIPCRTHVGGFGVVGWIGKKDSTNIVALRGDMDALPIQEANEVPYRSRNDGVMHACGHDVHTSSLLGAAKLLKDIEDQLPGGVKLIFQPAEERLPGGASIMIKDGVLASPSPQSIFGQHVHPPLEVGKVGMKGGMYMASTDEVYLTVQGEGGHGALPQNCIDPVTVSAAIVQNTQQLISRRADPTIPTVLTFGKIYSDGGATNVIPSRVFLEGTFRTMNEPWREKAHKDLRLIIEQTAAAFEATVDLEIRKGYPFLYNDEELTSRMKINAIEFLGEENVVDLPIRMTGEDFAYYSQEIPACFYRLGTGNKAQGLTSPIHTNTFDVDEQCLWVGAGLLAWNAYKELLYLTKK